MLLFPSVRPDSPETAAAGHAAGHGAVDSMIAVSSTLVMQDKATLARLYPILLKFSAKIEMIL